MTKRIRVAAVAMVRSGDRFLVESGHDRVENRDFYRAIGGGVEFGERAAAALHREWREEYGLSLEGVSLLGVLENVFTFEGRAGHEIVFVFAAQLSDPRALDRNEFESIDTDGARHLAVWVTLDVLRGGSTPLYPPGLLELLEPEETPTPHE